MGPVSRVLSEIFPPYIRAYVVLTAVIHVPFALLVKEAAAALGAPAPWAVGVTFAFCGTLFFLFASRGWRSDYPKRRAARLLVDIPYWIHWTACLLALVPAALVIFAAAALSVAGQSSLSLPISVWAAGYVTMIGIAFYGTVVRRRRFVVQEIPIHVKGLPAAFEGYRIAQLSDLHVGSMTPVRWAREWVSATNAAAPDLTVVTGDLISSGNAFHDAICEAVAGLSARDGVYFSLGNHDYFGDAERLVEGLRGRGGRVLRNEGVTIARGDARLYLAAVDDTWTERDDLARALADRPERAPVVLLAHDPASFWEAARNDVALTLSGHTHGGQIHVPWMPRLRAGLRLGRYVHGDSTLIVHPGLGTAGPPTRIGVPPTIAVYRLTADGTRSNHRARRVNPPRRVVTGPRALGP
jgi:predicted MPP superfamily phosphohydrolase